MASHIILEHNQIQMLTFFIFAQLIIWLMTQLHYTHTFFFRKKKKKKKKALPEILNPMN